MVFQFPLSRIYSRYVISPLKTGVRLTLRLAVSQSVLLSIESLFGAHDRTL
jgi:hypothetical protein